MNSVIKGYAERGRSSWCGPLRRLRANSRLCFRVRLGTFVCLVLSASAVLTSSAVLAEETAADRGYRHLLETPYVPAYFDQEVFDRLWETWPEPLRAEAAAATAEKRREMAFARYGLTTRPGDDSGLPLQFVVDEVGNWTPNCFTCHGGEVTGKIIPGLPNSHYALQTLIQETRLTKLRMNKPLATIDYGSLVMPLGTTHGTTNAVMFGVALAAYRDPDLNVVVVANRLAPFVHHDMDAPPWWHFSKKQRLYLEGFASKGHRPLMQFALDQVNGPDKFHAWEGDFRDIFAYLESLEPPQYPFAIDAALAREGEQVFNRVCAECHGTYGDRSAYPERNIPLDEIGTDRVRYDALTRRHHEDYQRNWFSNYGADPVTVDPPGYVAPPLDGVWASAPYFHNGSVPTLWHVLHPDQRPVVWRRTLGEYDREQVGLEVETLATVPRGKDIWTRRAYFDTRKFGKSAAGHRFPNALHESEKRAVLEYLKQL